MINWVKNHILWNMQLESMTLTIERDFFPYYFFCLFVFLSLCISAFSQISTLYPIPSLFPIRNKSFVGNYSFGDYSHFYMGLPDFYAIDSNSKVFSMIEFGLCFVCLWLAVEENIGRQRGRGRGEVGEWEWGKRKFGVNCDFQKDICLSMALSNSDL